MVVLRLRTPYCLEVRQLIRATVLEFTPTSAAIIARIIILQFQMQLVETAATLAHLNWILVESKTKTVTPKVPAEVPANLIGGE